MEERNLSTQPYYRSDIGAFKAKILANALYRADREAWQEVRDRLPDEVLADLRANSAYWAQYKGLTATVTQSLNDRMIKSYGDSLGTQSYGAVVDLLVKYYS